MEFRTQGLGLRPCIHMRKHRVFGLGLGFGFRVWGKGLGFRVRV